MSGQDNGLTLQSLAHRLEALERENAELRHKVVALEGSGTRRYEVAALRGSDRRPDKAVTSDFAGQVSRRSLLSKAGAAAVAAVAAGTLFNQRQAKATHFPDLVEADIVRAHQVQVIVDVDTGISAGGVLQGIQARGGNVGGFFHGTNPDGIGVWGVSEGYGGVFDGLKAQLRLFPSDTAGRPTSGAHSKGEIYMDSAGDAVCLHEGRHPGHVEEGEHDLCLRAFPLE